VYEGFDAYENDDVNGLSVFGGEYTKYGDESGAFDGGGVKSGEKKRKMQRKSSGDILAKYEAMECGTGFVNFRTKTKPASKRGNVKDLMERPKERQQGPPSVPAHLRSSMPDPFGPSKSSRDDSSNNAQPVKGIVDIEAEMERLQAEIDALKSQQRKNLDQQHY